MRLRQSSISVGRFALLRKIIRESAATSAGLTSGSTARDRTGMVVGDGIDRWRRRGEA
jgi:hypothetical protein